MSESVKAPLDWSPEGLSAIPFRLKYFKGTISLFILHLKENSRHLLFLTLSKQIKLSIGLQSKFDYSKD